jgi:alpha-1,6-mannosyltransferase
MVKISAHGDTESVAAVANGRTSTSHSRPDLFAMRTLGAVGLVGIVASVFGVSAGAAGSPSSYVPGRSGGWPGWLSGPLHGLGLGIGSSSFQALTLLMCAGYAAVLLTARVLPGKAIAVAIVAANLLLLVAPPLISQDVFGYLEFARLGVLHGLDPYTHVAAEAPTDAVFPFIGWPFQHSPYGPIFTLGTYPLASLGLAGGLWALKLLALLASLGAVALTASAASKMGRSAKVAAVFVGLNPVLLELALGGAHNDMLVLLVLAGALALAARTGELSPPRALAARPGELSPARVVRGAAKNLDARTDRRAADELEGNARNLRAAAALLVVGVGVKASAGLVLPFVVLAPRAWRERARVTASALAALAALALVAIVGFGAHAFGFLGALGEQQQLIATHSLPAETARWVGLSGLPGWWRDLFVAGFLLVLALTLWRTARGADWRAMAGWATLALLLSTAWLLPWYAIWALPLAALADSRRLRTATLAFCAYAILIHLPLANPVLSPARRVAHHRIGSHGRVADDDGLVFARLQVTRDTAFDLRG